MCLSLKTKICSPVACAAHFQLKVCPCIAPTGPLLERTTNQPHPCSYPPLSWCRPGRLGVTRPACHHALSFGRDPGAPRGNWEMARRTLVVRMFPNPAACLRLISALAVKVHEDWIEGTPYSDMEPWRQQQKAALRRLAETAKNGTRNPENLPNLTSTSPRKRLATGGSAFATRPRVACEISQA